MYTYFEQDMATIIRVFTNPEDPATGHLDPGFLGFPGS